MHTKHQLFTTNLYKGKVSLLHFVIYRQVIHNNHLVRHIVLARSNFQNNQRNNQCNMGSLERDLFEATSRSSRLESNIQRIWKSFGHCLGAIDGKHVAIEFPKLSGIHFFNYRFFLVWYCSQFAMQNIVLLMLTLVNMEVQTIEASWEVLVYIKRSKKTNWMCQLRFKLKGLRIHFQTFFLRTRYSRLILG